jgi:hypothetical protein
VNGVVHYVFQNVPPGMPIRVAITAYDAAGLESPYSNERLLNLSTTAPPRVDAGPDRAGLVGNTFTLGSWSAAGIQYLWEQTAGPPVALSQRANGSTSFTATTAGTFAFVLTAWNGQGIVARDTVNVVAVASPVAIRTPTPATASSQPPATPGNPASTSSYAVLLGASNAKTSVVVGSLADVGGSICAYTLNAHEHSRIAGDAVGLKRSHLAIRLGAHTSVGGNVATAGGNLIRAASTIVYGTSSTSGTAAGVAGCLAASANADNRDAALSAAPADQKLDRIVVKRNTAQLIGPPSAGSAIIDIPSIVVGTGASLVIQGGPQARLIVRLAKSMRILHDASIMLVGGMRPEQVLFVVDGAVTAGVNTRIAGSIFAAKTVRLGKHSTVDGQLLSATRVQLHQGVTVNLRPFSGW